VAAFAVVKTLDVLKDDESGLLPALELLTINAFGGKLRIRVKSYQKAICYIPALR
jgi:hypothetical protein